MYAQTAASVQVAAGLMTAMPSTWKLARTAMRLAANDIRRSPRLLPIAGRHDRLTPDEMAAWYVTPGWRPSR
jgi:hypothetical protein